MSDIQDRYPGLEISTGRTAYEYVEKFGHSSDVDGTETDVWDRANATDTDTIFTAPTQARIHAVVSSTTTDDDGNTGAHTVRVYGLTAWDADEVNEVVTMDGQTPVNTVNSYVMIHRIVVESWGSAGPNTGVITATAATDNSVTAQIGVGNGQTQMAVYGIPSTRVLYLTRVYATLERTKGGAAGTAEVKLKVNPLVETQRNGFITKWLGDTDESGVEHTFPLPLPVAGPAIVKITAYGSTTNMHVSGGFTGILESV